MAILNRAQRAALWAAPMLLCATMAHAEIRESFTGTAAPDWTISNNSALTAPSIDPDGQGWLRLNPLANSQVGRALLTGTSQPLAPNTPLYFEFEYVTWGGNGADGMAAFLYDASQNMSGAFSGGSLGYCAGAGAYLAIGLDEFGNFSGPTDPGNGGCGFPPGGQTATSQSVVIRGPQSASYPMVATTKYAAGIDTPAVTTRPAPSTVQVKLEPASPGYNVTVTLVRNGSPTVLHSNVPFPYAPPANVRVGFASSTGLLNNIHEVRNAVLAVLAELDVTKTLTTPTPATPGSTVSYKVTFFNRSAFDLASGSVNFEDPIPAEITSPTWTCAGTACPSASGSGNIQAVNGGIFPANGQAEFTVTGKLAAGVTNGQVISNTAKVSFVPNTPYSGPSKEATAVLTAKVIPPEPPKTPAPVPTLGAVGLVLMSLSFAGVGVYSIRRRKTNVGSGK